MARPAVALCSALVSAVLASATSNGYVAYRVDTTWTPRFPDGAGTFSAVGITGDHVVVSQRDARYSDPVLVLSRESGEVLLSFGGTAVGKVNDTFGSHGLSIQRADPASGRMEDVIWVMDFFNHTVLSFDLKGKLLGSAGRSGFASADLDKFDHVADATFRGGSAFFADGDGGDNNRVERWGAPSGQPVSVEWVSPLLPPAQRKVEEFSNPHGLTWHEASDRLLVADREHSRIVLMDPETGHVTGNFTCDGLRLGAGGKPFGVRARRAAGEDLLFVAVADNPQDGNNQFLHIVDVSTLAKTGGCKSVLQTIQFEPSFCRTPHLMGLDHETGDVYLACVGVPGSNLVRLTRGAAPAPAAAAAVLV